MKSLGFGVVVGAIVVACSSGGDGGAGASDSTSFKQQYCDLIAGTCCPKLGKTYNQAQCTGFLSIADSQGEVYDANAGSTCLTALQGAVANPTFCSDFGASTPALKTSCANVYKSGAGATKQPGEVCNQDSDCAPPAAGDVECSTHFSSDGSSSTKTCQVTLEAKEGDACVGEKIGDATSFGGDDSAPTIGICYDTDGLFCDDTTKKCAKRVAVGQPCPSGNANSCTTDARCDFTSQKCVALTALGADCSAPEASQCVADAYCDKTSKKCTATLAAGAACTDNDQCGTNAECTNQKCTSGNLTAAFLCGGN